MRKQAVLACVKIWCEVFLIGLVVGAAIVFVFHFTPVIHAFSNWGFIFFSAGNLATGFTALSAWALAKRG